MIALLPWGHHVVLLTKCRNSEEALFYVEESISNGWSRSILLYYINEDLYSTKGRAINNFDKNLSEPFGDYAKEILKDPYHFDFLELGKGYKEES